MSPAQKDLFKIRDDAKKLNDTNIDFFHCITARLLYTGKQAWPAVLFLCTQVCSPDEGNILNFKQLIEYIWGTIFILLILG